jgi:hypothetical protein
MHNCYYYVLNKKIHTIKNSGFKPFPFYSHFRQKVKVKTPKINSQQQRKEPFEEIALPVFCSNISQFSEVRNFLCAKMMISCFKNSSLN